MNVCLRRRSPQQGSILVVALFIACILGIVLGSCLVMVRMEHDSVARSQAWNSAITLAEGGIEEALAQLNPGAGAPPPSDGVYGPLSRTLSGGAYDVMFTAANASAVIFSTGRVAVPSLSATLSRVVQVTATNAPLLTATLATAGAIELNGSGFSTDSFDSADQNHSNNGHYPGYLSNKLNTNGTVAAVGGLLDTSYTHIHGDLFMGPGATYSPGNNGSISGTVYNDLNVDFPEVVAPATQGWFTGLPGSTIIAGTIYDHAFSNSWSYVVSGMSGNIYIDAGVKVTLKISGNVNLGDVWIANSGINSGKLTIYMAGPTFALNGNLSVDSGNPTNFTYFGLPGNTSVALSGGPDFTGTIYAPAADLMIDNAADPFPGEDTTFSFIGAGVTKSMNLSGYTRFCFHYDENLKRAGSPRRGYLATSWHEVP
jgi:hypothetical protein